MVSNLSVRRFCKWMPPVFLFFVLPGPTAADNQTGNVQTILEKALDALGGETRLRQLGWLQIAGVETRNLLEQSERPSGPWIVVHSTFDLTRSLLDSRLAMDIDLPKVPAAGNLDFGVPVQLGFDKGASIFRLSPDTDWRPAPNFYHSQIAFYAQYLPDALLTRLRSDFGAERLPDEDFQDRPHIVIGFEEENGHAKLYIDPVSYRATGLESVEAHPYDVMRNVWGDVKTTIYYSFWWSFDAGIHYPRQIDVFLNDQPYRQIALAEIAFPGQPENLDFEVSEDMRQQSLIARTRRVDDQFVLSDSFKELAPGIKFFEGAWNTVLVEQDDGVVVIEGVISSAFGAATIDKAKLEYPDLPLKAVISTSDAWPHIGGLRSFAAKGIPIYHLDDNEEIIGRLLRAPFINSPDLLAQSPREPRLHPISDPEILGPGPNRMQLIPIRGEPGERMLMIFFPEQELLYAADLLQFQQDGQWNPVSLENAFDLVRAVCDNAITVDKVFSMHFAPSPWDKTVAAIGLPPETYCEERNF